ncbi:MAG TPA: acetoacetate--CoA ligase [Candidatus Competibacteraceae bacterium]|nr:acetoacetate--CoA ligase [Candidatus Competibacteraceae bacterium]MCP5133195.1 acetoacetate--CoA ligase [Gammaproteobacteria bacterium]HPF57943.1 acetoacetate--CoA ligase [Candidatus Competibacteraceae bacterium]HRY17689.1 acetoacetate--CoA ligase [Candidatus Competibacteraceae bacterium]
MNDRSRDAAPAFDRPLWMPGPARSAATRMAAFTAYARQISRMALESYADLHAWSIGAPEQFWPAVWEFCGVLGERGEQVLADPQRMPGARWFPDARLNFAENLLRDCSNPEALVFWGENRVKRTLPRAGLRQQTAQFAAALKAAGIGPGDRVAAYLPNLPETIIALLAAASMGAVFTSASPDFGIQGVLDRFGQTEPKVLITCDGYWYNGKAVELQSKLAGLMPQLPSVQHLILVSYLGSDTDALAAGLPKGVSWTRFIAPYATVTDIDFAPLPFDHPLFIMYSSGTTGIPKCIVHGAGGTLLQHLKEHQLHSDLREGDRFFYFTTCGWMMWNWLVSGLASGATLLLYDGSPFVARGRILWDYAQTERMTHFGTSAKYLDALAKTGLKPRQDYDLRPLRAILSTGSPLVPERFDSVYAEIKKDLQLASISGGTDIISCFVLGNPMLPVWRGEIQCKGLGLAVEVWDDQGQSVREQKGELVCTRPFPCMPIGFWNDPHGKKYQAAYFEQFPGVWRHGDFCEITRHDGLIIHGRSDATLNPGGVRIGTAEIYRQVEKLSEVVESLVIGQNWEADVRLVLFVKLQEGVDLDHALAARIKQTIREGATPRHVPAKVLQVTDIPRTRSGKIVELAVRNIVHGQPVKNIEALANPEALASFANRSELQD